MSKQTKKSLVPKLRFPEFRDAGEWEKKALRLVCNMRAGKFVKASDIQENYKNELYPCFGGNGLRGYTKTYTHEGKYPLIGRQGELCGNVTFTGKKFHATEHAVVATPKSGINVVWLFYQLTNMDLNKFATGQAQPGLSVKVLESITAKVPKKNKEQQKIADCLSSIDDLITAQTQKLDALKAHKKGLMQKLFPAEGETVPKLRFPEFRNAGEWEEKKLGKLSTILRGGSPRPIDNYLTNDKDGLNWLKIGDVDKEAKYISLTEVKVKVSALSKTREVHPGDLIMSNSMSFGRPYIMQIKSCIHDGWIAVTEISEKINIYFLYYFILSNNAQVYFTNAAAGGGIKNLNADIIKQLPVSYPKLEQEQQKIADCLSSLDDLITVQTQKLDALKTHKKGLMQQLFPAMNEVGA
ncbi:MAG: restriction endonuclease subunit S [Campylobacterota bacterium]|nr:restriction endonuclease subunit S [Campylobacterota bacterium]